LCDPEEIMAEESGTKIVLQVGSELRVSNNGDITMDNPELELLGEDRAADAVLLYRFDPKAGTHVFRLLDPVAHHPGRTRSTGPNAAQHATGRSRNAS
jgi:hypothetical protein